MYLGFRYQDIIYESSTMDDVSIRGIMLAGVNAKTSFPASQPNNRAGSPFAIIPVPEIIGAYFFVGFCFGEVSRA